MKRKYRPMKTSSNNSVGIVASRENHFRWQVSTDYISVTEKINNTYSSLPFRDENSGNKQNAWDEVSVTWVSFIES